MIFVNVPAGAVTGLVKVTTFMLYLLPAARGLGLGKAMAEAVIATARGLGYDELRLDTLPSMTTAMRLYDAMGFERTGPYYAPTPEGTVFMRLKL